jgi:hypothetical protein
VADLQERLLHPSGQLSTEEIERAAYAESTRLDSHDLVGELQAVLGQKLTAAIAGVSDAKAVREWARGPREPQPEALQRLRLGYQVTRLLLWRDSPETVRAWFVGMNPALDDRSALAVIAEDPVRVLHAARAFLLHGT